MIADPRFQRQDKAFWAHIRSISEEVGYTARGAGTIKIPTLAEILTALRSLSLETDHVSTNGVKPTKFGTLLMDYFHYRAETLNKIVQPNLLDADAAKELFDELCAEYEPLEAHIPWNKQKGEKKKPAYLTAMVNMLIRANCNGFTCDFDPRSLTTITHNGKPVRTLARRVDGAFPAVVNPIAIWEIKEYYHTTTFGSRVADGVYETLLDGMELEELQHSENKVVRHLLMVDSHYTWWECGRSYLCRIIDMLHMGYVDEVLFGKEVVERLPQLVRIWVSEARRRVQAAAPVQLPGKGAEPKPEGRLGSGRKSRKHR
jgi:hypothetical protein